MGAIGRKEKKHGSEEIDQEAEEGQSLEAHQDA
jgi:hypothetical protein